MSILEGGVAKSVTAGRAIKNLRWYVCGLLFLATTINYLDRNAMGVLNPILKKEIGWDDASYGWINFAFQLSYAIMFGIAGRLLDKVGVRLGMIWAVIVWSFAAVSHAFARSAIGFSISRFALGLGEAANFPACIKTVAEWFPKRERALATGIFNAGSNVGILLAAFTIVPIALKWHWQAAFVLTGASGFLWLFLWSRYYRSPEQHPSLSAEERAHIHSDNEAPEAALHLSWTSLLRYPQAWAFLLGKMFTDPVWWFYLTWLPTYFVKEHNVDAAKASLMTIVPYIAADFGSVLGGWFSGFLMKRGWALGRARLLALGVAAVCMPGAIWAVLTKELWLAVALISLATAAHQAWSANIFTVASDMFPKRVVASVVGLGGMAGAVGGMFMQLVAGGLLQSFGTYVPLFVIAGVMHPLALVAIVVFAGKDFRPVNLETGPTAAANRNLRVAGASVVVAGLVLVAAVLLNWGLLAHRSMSAASQGLTASIGVALLGIALLYASRQKAGAVAA
jgi:ACS family hexuronate transporter-like MFS transporter